MSVGLFGVCVCVGARCFEWHHIHAHRTLSPRLAGTNTKDQQNDQPKLAEQIRDNNFSNFFVAFIAIEAVASSVFLFISIFRSIPQSEDDKINNKQNMTKYGRRACDQTAAYSWRCFWCRQQSFVCCNNCEPCVFARCSASMINCFSMPTTTVRWSTRLNPNMI